MEAGIISSRVGSARVYSQLSKMKIVRVLILLFVQAELAASAATRMQFDPKTGQWIKTEVSQTWKNSRSRGPLLVPFSERMRRGAILIDTKRRSLFHVLGEGQAMRYSIGVGRDGFTWKGKERISRKEEWPSWTPPEEMRAREAAKGNLLPKRMAGGPENPLGARALYLGGTLFRIHGTNQPGTIGRAISSGCIRMENEDVIHLFDRVKTGTVVVVR